MQEITSEIIIETAYLGVTLGAINAPHGLVLIDSPLKLDDTRAWRAALLNLGGGVDRMMINLDAHPDRTLGARAMECTVVGHEKIAQAFRNRPTTFKSQNSETGADWEFISSLGTIRWNPPEISFSEGLHIQWGSHPINLVHRPGPSAGAIWAVIPNEKVIFVGDAVVKNQPPFLSNADLPVWIESLKELLTPTYQNYFIISGRGGLISQDEVRKELAYLEEVQTILATINPKTAPEMIEKHITTLLAPFKIAPEQQTQFSQRLRWGLTHHRTHEGQTSTPESEE
jgi:glyoxylase-like metal-dependent hydrolase (beta-lactamase superfamily II)